MDKELLRRLPKTDALLRRPALTRVCEDYPYAIVKDTLQNHMEGLRAALLSGVSAAVPTAEQIESAVVAKLQSGDIFSLKRVINATGVVLHTNLGRAPLGREAAGHIADVASGYCTLEYDVAAGARGSRYAHVEKLICDITGAEAAMAVNNNAGAVFLMLNTLAAGKKVAISRGELVEIGGSFRVPEIMAQSGAELLEIGTTNKTHFADYERAVEQGAEVLLKVHTSNFIMTGFTESVEIDQLGRLGREKGCLVLHDLGSGFLFPGETLGLGESQTVARCIRDGADVVCFSGDKLLGSAQAGILAGKKEYIERIKKNHLTRMLRIDKLSLAALELTLKYSRDPELAREKIPALNMLSKTELSCREAALDLAERIGRAAPEVKTQVVPVEDEAGGGSLPGVSFKGAAVAAAVDGLSPIELEKRLRERGVPIITRVSKEGVLFSARTLCDGDAESIAAAIAEIDGGLAR